MTEPDPRDSEIARLREEAAYQRGRADALEKELAARAVAFQPAPVFMTIPTEKPSLPWPYPLTIGCQECQRSTSGRCPRHWMTFGIINTACAAPAMLGPVLSGTIRYLHDGGQTFEPAPGSMLVEEFNAAVKAMWPKQNGGAGGGFPVFTG